MSQINTQKMIETCKEYVARNLKENLAKYITQNNPWVKFNFNHINSFEVQLGTAILEEPTEAIKALEIALESNDIKKSVRIFNIPKTEIRHIWEVRKTDIGRFMGLKGTIGKVSSILNFCKMAKFECPACSAVHPVLMLNQEYKEPKRCGCGFKGKMHCLERQFSDVIKITIQDNLMDETNKDRTITREKMAILEDDLTHQLIDKQIKPGRQVIVNGWFEYKQKSNSSEFDTIFLANSIEFIKVGWDTVKIQNPQKLREISDNPTFLDDMADSIADVKGHHSAKIACLLQLAGAPTIYDANNHLDSRGTIHVLLVGDPGTAKTFLAKRAATISPINSFQTATTASGKGLVASVTQDKEMGWVLYPGVVPMAHKGIVVIDEIDKTAKEEYGDHNNAMNDMEVPIAKANIKARLDTETCYLATANPENRIFTPHEIFYHQIDMPKDFLDRFDIIFPMTAPYDKESKNKIMSTMMDRHTVNKTDWKPKYSHEEIRQYIAYCRKEVPRPVLNSNLIDYIKEQSLSIMQPSNQDQVKISFRHLESIMRFAYASARLHLRDITKEDIDIAVNLKKRSFIELGIINEHGDLDWRKMEGIDEEKIKQKYDFMDIVNELMPKSGDECSVDDLLKKCEEHSIIEDDGWRQLQKLKTRGDLFEPKPGRLKKI